MQNLQRRRLRSKIGVIPYLGPRIPYSKAPHLRQQRAWGWGNFKIYIPFYSLTFFKRLLFLHGDPFESIRDVIIVYMRPSLKFLRGRKIGHEIVGEKKVKKSLFTYFIYIYIFISLLIDIT